jgi:hypothetical protein
LIPTAGKQMIILQIKECFSSFIHEWQLFVSRRPAPMCSYSSMGRLATRCEGLAECPGVTHNSEFMATNGKKRLQLSKWGKNKSFDWFTILINYNGWQGSREFKQVSMYARNIVFFVCF